jgi:hypothetical protein
VPSEWTDEDQQLAWLNAIDRANREGKLAAGLPYTRQQLRNIAEIVKNDLESYQPKALPQRNPADARRQS